VVVPVELQIAVAPIQRPQTRRLRRAKPRDRKPRPFRTEIRAPRRATLHDRQTPLVDLSLNANLMSNMLGCSGTTAAPEQRPSPADPTPASLPPRTHPCCDVHRNLPSTPSCTAATLPSVTLYPPAPHLQPTTAALRRRADNRRPALSSTPQECFTTISQSLWRDHNAEP